MTEQEIKKVNQKLTDCFLFGANLKVSYFTKDLFTNKVVEEKEMTLSFIDSNVAKLKGDSRDASFCLDISGYYSRLNMEKEADEYRTKAINYFKSIIEQYPDSAEIYFLLGSTVKFNVDIEGCMNYYRKALSIYPSYSDAAAMMAQKYAMVGQLDSTYNIIINHINHFPKDTAFYLSAPIYYLSKQISIIQKIQTLEEIKNYSLDSLTSMP
ncbi:MAG: hypothetical protein JNM51_03875, partial [Bacteroidia bacterium]|nr:hypothetical protein [Bacteroidia bacterium]